MKPSAFSFAQRPHLIILLVIFVQSGLGFAQNLATAPDLGLEPRDLRLENSNDGGYILLVRAKPEIKSILITESTEPETHKIATYTMRTKVANPLNNDLKRILDGKVLDRPDLYFLVTSTPVPDSEFGQAFRLFVPYVVEYGFPEGRHGERQLLDGAFLSIRAFSRPWADYGGSYHDNPYKLKLTQAPPKAVTGDGYNKETVTTFRHLASKANLHAAANALELPQALETILKELTDPEIDLVLCLDATGSMEPYVPFVKNEVVPILEKFLEGHHNARFAYVQYRDYFEEFLYQITPFTTDFKSFQNALNHYRPLGGGDIPEAVDEALYGAANELPWLAPRRIIVLVGDAPPHPIPRGKVTHEMVDQILMQKHIEVLPIVLPSGISATKKP